MVGNHRRGFWRLEMTRKSKGGPDPLRDKPTEADKRNKINRHNGLSGGVYFARSVMRQIQDCETTTAEAKGRAHMIECNLDILIEHIKERVGP